MSVTGAANHQLSRETRPVPPQDLSRQQRELLSVRINVLLRDTFSPVFTSMGLTVMVRAESSQSISFSLPLSWSLMVRWCAARMRKTPRMIMNTRKLTHTTMTMVAALGTTAIQPKQEHKQTK